MLLFGCNEAYLTKRHEDKVARRKLQEERAITTLNAINSLEEYRNILGSIGAPWPMIKKKLIILKEKYRKEYSHKFPEILDAIINRKILIGMTQEDVLHTKGKPSRISMSVDSWGTHDFWTYGYSSTYYFINGILVSYNR